MPPLINFEKLGPPPPNTRASVDSCCNCHICSLARLNLSYKSYADDHSNPHGNPNYNPKSPPGKAVPFCSKCFTEIGRGIPHPCVKSQKVSNISSLVKNTSEKSRSKVAASTIKTIAGDHGVSTRGGIIELPSGTKSLQVQIGNPKIRPKQPKFSHENLIKLQTANNLSDRNLL